MLSSYTYNYSYSSMINAIYKHDMLHQNVLVFCIIKLAFHLQEVAIEAGKCVILP